jgi:hypothetical protein
VVPCAYVVMHTAADRVRGYLLAPRGRAAIGKRAEAEAGD